MGQFETCKAEGGRFGDGKSLELVIGRGGFAKLVCGIKGVSASCTCPRNSISAPFVCKQLTEDMVVSLLHGLARHARLFE